MVLVKCIAGRDGSGQYIAGGDGFGHSMLFMIVLVKAIQAECDGLILKAKFLAEYTVVSRSNVPSRTLIYYYVLYCREVKVHFWGTFVRKR